MPPASTKDFSLIDPPEYGTLLSWWDSWPQARPELLDFWARGNFARRVLSRGTRKQAACLVRVRYIDELDAALKRLALLGIEVDFAWTGSVTAPGLVLAPQHVDYEDSGGWGYITAAGDEMADDRGNLDWCPALGVASLLPDTVTDWLAEEAAEFLSSGKLLVCPVDNIGLLTVPSQESEMNFGTVANSMSLLNTASLAKVIFELELPMLEGISVRDTYRFCQDHRDSLTRFQTALGKLLDEDAEMDDTRLSKVVAEIRDSVAELRLSHGSLSLRKQLTALGASISAFGITVGVQLGLAPAAATVGSVAAAIGIMGLWHRNIEAEAGLRAKPYYALWKLEGHGTTKPGWRSRPWSTKLDRIAATTPPLSENQPPPYHWLTEPTAGWDIPTGFMPQDM